MTSVVVVVTCVSIIRVTSGLRPIDAQILRLSLVSVVVVVVVVGRLSRNRVDYWRHEPALLLMSVGGGRDRNRRNIDKALFYVVVVYNGGQVRRGREGSRRGADARVCQVSGRSVRRRR